MNDETGKNRLVVALDFPTARAALEMDEKLGDSITWVKVGLELFIAAGPAILEPLKKRGRRIFLDLKLHDIPNTVAGAVGVATTHGADMLTVHCEGGPAMMRAAREARDASGEFPKLLGVTVLTSLDGSEFPGVYRDGVAERVIPFARAAETSGLDGVVCSPLELETLRSEVSEDFLRVIPGIRPGGEASHDQSRVATPRAAIMAGATHLVVGRAITRAPDPAEAAGAILREIQIAAKDRSHA